MGVGSPVHRARLLKSVALIHEMTTTTKITRVSFEAEIDSLPGVWVVWMNSALGILATMKYNVIYKPRNTS